MTLINIYYAIGYARALLRYIIYTPIRYMAWHHGTGVVGHEEIWRRVSYTPVTPQHCR